MILVVNGFWRTGSTLAFNLLRTIRGSVGMANVAFSEIVRIGGPGLFVVKNHDVLLRNEKYVRIHTRRCPKASFASGYRRNPRENFSYYYDSHLEAFRRALFCADVLLDYHQRDGWPEVLSRFGEVDPGKCSVGRMRKISDALTPGTHDPKTELRSDHLSGSGDHLQHWREFLPEAVVDYLDARDEHSCEDCK